MPQLLLLEVRVRLGELRVVHLIAVGFDVATAARSCMVIGSCGSLVHEQVVFLSGA